jgi:hypothetical protein
MSQYDQYLAASFARAESRGLKAADPEALADFYDEIRERINNAYGQRDDFEQVRETLEDAISLHMASIGAVATRKTVDEEDWLERRLAPLRKVVEGFKSKYGFIAVAGTMLADFIKPIVDLALPVMFGSLIGGTGLVMASRLLKASREKLEGAALICGLLLTCSTGLWTAQYLLPGAADKGVIADVIPGAGKAQNAVLAALGMIEGNTRRSAEGIDRIGSSVETLKKETSSDPRKELANVGIMWSEDAFSAAVLGNDPKSVELFLKAGRQVQSYLIIGFLDRPFRKDIGELLLRFKDQVDRKVCTNESVPMALYQYGIWLQSEFITQKLQDQDKKTFFFSLCDARAVRTIYEAKANKLKSDAADYDQRVAQQVSDRNACIANLTKKYIPSPRGMNSMDADRLAEKAYDEGAEMVDRFGKMSARLALEERSRERSGVYASIRSARMMGSNSDGIISTMIAKGCHTAYSTPSRPNPSELTRLQSVLEAIGGRDSAPVPTPPDSAPRIDTPGSAMPRTGPPPPAVAVTPQIPAAAPPQQRTDGSLTATDVRRDILGKNLNHDDRMDITFDPNGTFASGDGRIGRNGKYQLMDDGRLCWRDNLGFDGCFQYFRENGALKVRRSDAKSREVIGTVKVTSR